MLIQGRASEWFLTDQIKTKEEMQGARRGVFRYLKKNLEDSYEGRTKISGQK